MLDLIPPEVWKQIIDAGWEVQDDVTVVCPHGHPIEWDGVCPDGCVSIIRQLGFI